MTALAPLGTAPRPPAATPTASAPIAEAGRRFEALLLRQMLAAARQTHFDAGGVFSGNGLDTFREMQDSRFADIAAQTGALGLGKLIAAQLARLSPPSKG